MKMKTIKMISAAALALMMGACSNSDDFSAARQVADANGGITITAVLAPKGNDGMRAVSEDTENKKIVTSWAVDETIAILYKVNDEDKKAVATVMSVDATTGAATIEFTVDANTTNNTICTLVYPSDAAKDDNSGIKGAADLIGAQDGKLSAKLDIRKGTGTIQTTTPGLTVTEQPAAQYAIWKLTLKSGSTGLNAKKLLVNADGVACNVTPASASNVLYVAVPATSGALVTMNATDGADAYVYGKDGVTLEAGKYYQSEVTLTKVVAVDLGLSKKWANINIGASSAEQYGSFFAWGGTTGYSSAATVTDGHSFDQANAPYYSGSAYTKYTSGDVTLEAADDAATQNWGSNWKMPTKADFNELMNASNCDKEWVENYEGTGISGYKFTKNGNSIFLPAASYRINTSVSGQGSFGYYWSSSLYSSNPDYAWSLYFASDYAGVTSYYRFGGRSGRAVYAGE